jgi:hypothetical protein
VDDVAILVFGCTGVAIAVAYPIYFAQWDVFVLTTCSGADRAPWSVILQIILHGLVVASLFHQRMKAGFEMLQIHGECRDSECEIKECGKGCTIGRCTGHCDCPSGECTCECDVGELRARYIAGDCSSIQEFLKDEGCTERCESFEDYIEYCRKKRVPRIIMGKPVGTLVDSH